MGEKIGKTCMEGNLAILTKILFKHCWWNENEKNLCGRKRICEIVSIQLKKQYKHFSVCAALSIYCTDIQEPNEIYLGISIMLKGLIEYILIHPSGLL